MTELAPWADYPGITVSRLSFVASRIVQARAGSIALHDPLSGDSAWSLGCRAYSRSCFGIRQGSDHLDWLTILPDPMPLRLTFAIDGWPIRFYRGDIATVPKKYLVATTAELSQQKLAFDDAAVAPISVRLRLAVLTATTGEVLSVCLVEFDTLTTLPLRSFDVPLTAPSAVMPFAPPKPGVILPPATVGPVADTNTVPKPISDAQ